MSKNMKVTLIWDHNLKLNLIMWINVCLSWLSFCNPVMVRTLSCANQLLASGIKIDLINNFYIIGNHAGFSMSKKKKKFEYVYTSLMWIHGFVFHDYVPKQQLQLIQWASQQNLLEWPSACTLSEWSNFPSFMVMYYGGVFGANICVPCDCEVEFKNENSVAVLSFYIFFSLSQTRNNSYYSSVS